MKLYKNTILVSTTVFVLFVGLSFGFNCCDPTNQWLTYIVNLSIGIACSDLIVLITSILQYIDIKTTLINNISTNICSILFFWKLLSLSSKEEEKDNREFFARVSEQVHDCLFDAEKSAIEIELFDKKRKQFVAEIANSLKMIDINNSKASSFSKHEYVEQFLADNKKYLKVICKNLLLLNQNNSIKEEINNWLSKH